MQFQAKFLADPEGSHEAKIKSHPALTRNFRLFILEFSWGGGELPSLEIPVGGSGPNFK